MSVHRSALRRVAPLAAALAALAVPLSASGHAAANASGTFTYTDVGGKHEIVNPMLAHCYPLHGVETTAYNQTNEAAYIYSDASCQHTTDIIPPGSQHHGSNFGSVEFLQPQPPPR